YNRETFLEEAIRSVLEQKYDGSLEIIVSDDGSTDRSLEIAHSFGSQVCVVLKDDKCKSQGVSGARNRGIVAATQPYLAFLDSDDFYLPNHLNRMAEVLESSQELGFVFSRMLQMKEQAGRRLFAPWTRARVTARDIRYPVITGAYVVHTNTFLFRRSVIVTAGIFNELYSNGEDGDLWMRISEKFKGAFADHYGAVYRIAHEFGQLTNTNNQDQIQQCFKSIFADALYRCQSQSSIDRYRLFRLRLILAFYNQPYWLALLRVVFRHPFLASMTFLSPRRLLNRNSNIEYQKLQDFVAL
ncbi:MAG: glycosyltransferase family 2 protein, partial [Chlorobiaceae bacterium]|nr:glycosyltransferase family 2 protein [Chlorobiaceae bacterium]